MEVQRLVSIVPVAVAHRALKDSILMGHIIPEVRCKTGLNSLFRSLFELMSVSKINSSLCWQISGRLGWLIRTYLKMLVGTAATDQWWI